MIEEYRDIFFFFPVPLLVVCIKATITVGDIYSLSIIMPQGSTGREFILAV